MERLLYFPLFLKILKNILIITVQKLVGLGRYPHCSSLLYARFSPLNYLWKIYILPFRMGGIGGWCPDGSIWWWWWCCCWWYDHCKSGQTMALDPKFSITVLDKYDISNVVQQCRKGVFSCVFQGPWRMSENKIGYFWNSCNGVA